MTEDDFVVPAKNYWNGNDFVIPGYTPGYGFPKPPPPASVSAGPTPYPFNLPAFLNAQNGIPIGLPGMGSLNNLSLSHLEDVYAGYMPGGKNAARYVPNTPYGQPGMSSVGSYSGTPLAPAPRPASIGKARISDRGRNQGYGLLDANMVRFL